MHESETAPGRGFLPPSDPLKRLPSAYDRWEDLAGELPKLLAADQVRTVLEDVPVLEISSLNGPAEYERAMLLLSYFGHAYVWGSANPASRVPRGVAIPWHAVAIRLGRPPVLSYASYALNNWRRLDPSGPIALGNIVLLQNFLGGLDEEWFVLVHVETEAEAGEALAAIGPAQKAVESNSPELVAEALGGMAASLQRTHETLLRMPEHCDPYIYFNRVRPYLYGWKDQPALPDGVIYEGVGDYGGRPQKFRGETGAQSGIIPSLDAALGISHKADPLRTYLIEMREYMPPKHRAFLETVERGPSIRQYVQEHRQSHPELRDDYNMCVEWIDKFRSTHLEYAARYIQQQSQRSESNLPGVGTGGTPFMPYLLKHLEETQQHMIP